MARITTFTLRVNAEERRILASLAARLERSQSDAVRVLIREAARDLLPDREEVQQPGRPTPHLAEVRS